MSKNQGKFVWYELMTSDTAAAERFYRSVVGWNAKDAGMPDMSYTIFSAGEHMVGGLMATPKEAEGMPPGWIGRVLDAYERDSSVVCVSGPYVYDELSRVKRTFVQLYWRLLAMPMYRFTHYMAVGGNFAASKAALLRIGGFDTTISFYGEDTNIARRLAQEGKVVFDLRLVMKTSARRLQDEGFATTAVRYALNFGSELLLKRPFTRQYRDIR